MGKAFWGWGEGTVSEVGTAQRWRGRAERLSSSWVSRASSRLAGSVMEGLRDGASVQWRHHGLQNGVEHGLLPGLEPRKPRTLSWREPGEAALARTPSRCVDHAGSAGPRIAGRDPRGSCHELRGVRVRAQASFGKAWGVWAPAAPPPPLSARRSAAPPKPPSPGALLKKKVKLRVFFF